MSCNAQSQTISLSSSSARSSIAGAYYKDTENDFISFLGSWKFTNGNKSFYITLSKKTFYFDTTFNIYEDLVVGEYRYVENNVEKTNTLNLLFDSAIDPYDRNIVGNTVMQKTTAPICSDCEVDEKRLSLMFDDPTINVKGLSGEIELRRVDQAGVERLKMILRKTGNLILQDGMVPEVTSFNVPFGTYILTRP